MATMLSKQIAYDKIVIGHGDWESLDFLPENAPNVKSVFVGGDQRDVSALEKLAELEHLALDYVKEPKVDLERLSKLKSVIFEYFDKRYFSVFKLANLTSLVIAKYPGKDGNEIAKLSSLENLEIRQGSLVTLDHLDMLHKLRRLVLSHIRALADIRAVERLPSLEHIEIAKCAKLTSQKIIEQIPTKILVRRLNFHNANEDLDAIPKNFGGLHG